VACCPKAPARQLGLLRVLLDDIPGAAALLAARALAPAGLMLTSGGWAQSWAQSG